MNKNSKYSYLINSPIWLIALIIILIFFINIYFFCLPLDFNRFMDEGDFGRDMYDFWLVSQGKLPYIDFDWIYGPLVPFLYGLVFKLFGTSAFNALVLWYLNFVITVLLLFYIVKSFSNSFMAFIASLIFILFYEGFLIMVFNHVTGLIFILLTFLFLLKFFNSKKIFYVYLISLSCFLLMMVKLNMGIAFSLPVLGLLILFNFKDKHNLKHIFYSISIIMVSLISLYSYIFLNSPFDQIGKSFPYFANSHTISEINLITFAANFLYSFVNDVPQINSFYFTIFTFSSISLWYFVAIIFGALFLFFIYKNCGLDSTQFKFVSIVTISSLMCTHEFILIGSSYSLQIWSLISIIVLVFYVINFILTEMTLSALSSKIFKAYAIMIFIVIFVKFNILMLPASIKTYKCHQNRLQIHVFKPHWYILMNKMTEYITANTSSDEKLFCYPYCALYNFVTNRPAPSRITEFLYISNITEMDQNQIIKDLEKHKVKLVLNIQLQSSPISGYGQFGETHCLLLDAYIKANYKLDETFYDDYLDGIRVPIYFYKRKTNFI